MNEFLVSVYSNKNSKIKLFIENNIKKLKEFNFAFYEISQPLPPEKVLGSLIILEETALNNIVSKFGEILKSYDRTPIFIVFSEKPTIKSAVIWMKLGADNYIEVNKELTPRKLSEILRQSFFFENQVLIKESSIRQPFDYQPIKLNHNSNWQALDEGKEYKMSLLSFSIVFQNKKTNLSNKYIEDILSKTSIIIEKIATDMGGQNLFWKLLNGLFVFYFGDRQNSAVASAISILNKILLFGLEYEKISSEIGLKITIHDGKIIYNSKDTRFITSDTLNSISHLHNNIEGINCIDITENVFTALNPRLKKLFYNFTSYEGRLIYSYYHKF